MVERSTGQTGPIIRSISLAWMVCFGTSANARNINVNGLPCNDVCQSWLGVEETTQTTPSVVDTGEPEIDQSTQQAEKYPSKLDPAPPRRKLDATKIEHVAPGDSRFPSGRPKIVAAKPVRPKASQARANGPVPVSRPAIPSDLPASTTDVSPSETPQFRGRPHKAVAAVASPQIGTRPIASDRQVLPPTSDRVVARDTPRPNDQPAQTVTPAAVAPAPPQTPSAVTPAPFEDAASPDGRMVVPRPQAQAQPQAQAPADIVGSIPSPADAGSGQNKEGHPGTSTQEGDLHPPPDSAETPLPVTIGQISAEARGTNVHVLIVNVLQHEVNGIDLRCRARDAQGLQVAEVSARIAAIAPSDVALQQLIFPPEITARDESFTCEAGKTATTGDRAP